MPNAFASLAIAVWPGVVLAVYGYQRSRASIARTTAWMMLLPVMFLPCGAVFPGPGALNKDRLAFLSVWIALQAFHRRELRERAPSRLFPGLMLLVLAVGMLQTVATNADTLVFGPRVIPGIPGGDGPSIVFRLALSVYVPFVIGQQVFRTERDLLDLLEVLSLCGLIYVPFCLVELRLSPQFHHWVYGFTPGTFLEAVRGSGYRPIVFMENGLAVATFSFTTLAASLALAKAGPRSGALSFRLRSIITGALVLACKSLGAMMYAALAIVLRAFASNTLLARSAALLLLLVIAYPTLRITNTFPENELVEFFGRISPERAASLAYRFKNEDALLVRALERPWYGWGYSARAWVYGADGSTTTVTDGLWIILLGNSGFVGLTGFFALIIVPVFRFLRSRSRMSATAQILGGALMLIVVVYGIDFLPNSMFDFLPLAYAGALHTLSGRLPATAGHRPASAPIAERPPGQAGTL